MRRLLVVAAGLVLGLLICSVAYVSLAQEELEYSWGIVSSLSSNQIVVTEYDYDSDEDVDVTYTIDPQLDLRNVESLKDIEVGDSVDIEYEVSSGERVAKIITVWETYEEGPEYSPEEIE